MIMSGGRRWVNPHGRMEVHVDADVIEYNDLSGPEMQRNFRRMLMEVDNELVKRDLESLKFLCRNVVPPAIQERIERGIDLFQELEVRGLLSVSNLKYFAECLVGIGRTDLLRKLQINPVEFQNLLLAEGEDISPYRKLLMYIAENLLKKEVSTLVYLMTPQLGLSKVKASQIKTLFEVILALEHSGFISDRDVTVLIDFLSQVGRPDLVEKGLQYQESISSAGDIEILKCKAALKLSPSDTSSGLVYPAPMPEAPISGEPVNPYGCAPTVPMATQLNPQDIPLRHASAVNYGPESEELPNIAVSMNEARFNPDQNDSVMRPVSQPQPPPGPPLGYDFVNPTQQQHLAEQMQHMGLYREDVDLPSYPMSSKPRGICLIINNFKFYRSDDPESRKMPDLHGTDVDATNLETVFRRLDFIVEKRSNLTHTEMVLACTEYAMKEEQRNFSCFACCVLSHGVKDHLYGTNGMKTPITEITSCFKAQRCPGLRGKPKLFFIQACQGRDKQRGFPIEMDAPAGEEIETIPNEADFLLGYATVPGFVSYRSKINGSWYITTLCDNLYKYGSRYDLLSIMTKVNEEVSVANASMDDGQFKQIPAPISTLRKKVYFK